MFEPGLVSISFRSLGYEEIIKLAVEAGLKSIEWGSDVHAPCGDKEKLMAIAKATKESGLHCCSYGTYFRLGVTDNKALSEHISAAEILGTDVLRLWCGDKGYSEYSHDEKEKLISACKEAAKIAEENHVTFCLECHNNTFTDCLAGAKEVMAAVSSPNFRMYWQPNQHRTTEENLLYAETMAEYTEHIHVFNWLGDKRFPLKEGKTLWKEYLKKLPGDRCLLLEFVPDDRPETLKTEAEALFEIIKEA